MTTAKESRSKRLLLEIGGATGAVSLLTWYILPNTAFCRLSPWSWFVWSRTGVTSKLEAGIIALLCLGVWAPLVRRRGEPSPADILVWGTGTYTLLLALSACFSGSSLAAANDCLSILLALTTGLAAAYLASFGRALLAPLVILALIQAIYALLLQLNGLNTVHSGVLTRAGGTYSQPIFLYAIMVVGFPVATTIALNGKSRIEAAIAFVPAAVCFAALSLTWSRNAYVAAAVAVLFTLWKAKRGIKWFATTGVVVFTVAVLPFLIRTIGPLNSASTTRSNVGRAYVARAALDQIKRSPLTGVGMANVKIEIAWPKEYLAGRRPQEALADPRSVPLLWMMEMGIIGGVLFASLLWGVCKFAWSASIPESVALASGLVGLLASSIFDVPFGTVIHSAGTALLGYLVGGAIVSTRSANVQVSNDHWRKVFGEYRAVRRMSPKRSPRSGGGGES